MMRPTDPSVLDAIDAEFALAVYDASRLAHRRMSGDAPPPSEPNPRALELLGRMRERGVGPEAPQLRVLVGGKQLVSGPR